MKKRLIALLTLALLLFASGCKDTPPEIPDESGTDISADGGTEADTGTETDETEPTQTDTQAPATSPADTEPVPPVESTPLKETPYKLKVTRPDLMIYKEPGYDYQSVGTLVDIGLYTIVEEKIDNEGIKWGKLKSGIGWIDLDKAETAAGMIPITMEIVRAAQTESMDCHLHIVEEATHTRYLLFEAYEPLRDIRFCSMDLVEDSFQPGEVIFTLDELKPGKPMVIGVVFHGDFTTFGLTFTCDGGHEASYRIYESGRNGSVEMQEYPMQ